MKNIASCQKLVNKLCAHSRMTCQRISPHAQPHALHVSRTSNTDIFFTSRIVKSTHSIIELILSHRAFILARS